MFSKKPISMAVSATCLLVAGNSEAADADTVSELCGTTISENTFVNYCNGNGQDTLTADCSIKVGDGNNLSIVECDLNADGFEFEIKGGKDSFLDMDNGSISNAADINIVFKGVGIVDDDTAPCHSYTVIDIDDYDLDADGEDGSVTIKSSCGGINISNDDNYSRSRITAMDSVIVQAKIGDVHVGDHSGNTLVIGAGPIFGAGGGEIKITAGGEAEYPNSGGGNVTTNCVDFFAGSIKIESDGNAPLVGCYN
jgi:hypothetical protein